MSMKHSAGPALVMVYMGRDGDQPVAEFHREPNGGIRVDVLDTPYRDGVAGALQAVGLYRLRRAVQPAEGDLYLEALRETLGRRSVYRFEAGPDSGSPSIRNRHPVEFA